MRLSRISVIMLTDRTRVARLCARLGWGAGVGLTNKSAKSVYGTINDFRSVAAVRAAMRFSNTARQRGELQFRSAMGNLRAAAAVTRRAPARGTGWSEERARDDEAAASSATKRTALSVVCCCTVKGFNAFLKCDGSEGTADTAGGTEIIGGRRLRTDCAHAADNMCGVRRARRVAPHARAGRLRDDRCCLSEWRDVTA